MPEAMLIFEFVLTSLVYQKPVYANTAAYGHFGRLDHECTWERTDKVAILKEKLL